MCQQGQAEVRSVLLKEKELIHQKWEAFQCNEIQLTDDELKTMAVRMIMIKDAL